MKIHRVETIADLMSLATFDNVDALAADIRGLLVNAIATKALVEVASPGSSVGMFKGAAMSWKDDGVNEQRITGTSGDGKSLQFVTTSLKNKGKHKPARL